MSGFSEGARRRIEILKELQDLAAEPDATVAHQKADDLIIEYLGIVGATEIIAAYKSISPKQNL
jgi:hypothetical protein